MFVFIIILLVALVGLGLGIVGFFFDHEDRFISWGVGFVLVLIAIVSLFFDMLTSVGTKNLGVVTFGGKPIGHLTNGYHLVAPWDDVHELTDAVQTDTYASDGGAGGSRQGGATETCVNVRIARQGTACVNVSIRWQIKANGVDYLFRNFKDNNAITDNLVLRDLQTSLNQALTAYDPLGIDTNGMSTNPPLTSVSSQVQNQMRQEIGTWIDVQAVNIPLLNFDGTTQSKINQLQQQIVATRIAQQQLVTNQAQARANQALAQSVTNSPGVLEDKCLNILKEAVDKGQNLPAGFSCFGGSNSTAIAVK